MTNETVITAIAQLVEPLLANEPGYFLVEVKIKPTNNIKVFIDADQGASIDKLIAFNRALYPLIEASGIVPADDFSLEVSSPGLDEPLKNQRQYVKNIGRKVEVTLLDGTQKEGVLLAVDDSKLTLEQTIGKKKEKVQIEINNTEIKHTKVCIVF
ncbi:ribosome maturation factor RimP [Chitinophaga skermanii]|uniref:Ribosome maturation factor RimP n=1 Tax=Chitinophaga skermanii TaxID=331697 RepID=A0A327QCA4_9BACT|nr:ribosome maturation factor [Chitinophaga skermanii]RAJ01605.1 ribosome maturation factor RimP [Chitinophaga skermanii]